MPRLEYQPTYDEDDRFGIRSVLAVAAVIAVVAGSLTAASLVDPIVRRLAPNSGGPAASAPATMPALRRGPAPSQGPAPLQVPAPSQVPASNPSAPQDAFAPVEASPLTLPASPSPLPAPPMRQRDARALPATLPQQVMPPPRPAVADEEREAEERPQTTNRTRESRRQVARNVRNSRARRDEVDADPASLPASGLGAYALVSEARRYIGTNPTNMARLWCARFMNYVLTRSGYAGTGSDAALSFAHYGRRLHGPRIGAIAVMRRRGGGHVGIVSGIDRHGNPILISGNNGRHGVAETVYPRSRIIAYVMPRR